MHPFLHDPYPLDVAGPLIASSALEHSLNTSTSVELTTIAALTCAAAVVQDVADVQRPDLPPSSTSVICVGVAASGEGKSTAAKPFLHPLEKVQERMDLRTEEQHLFEARTFIWKEKLARARSQLRRQLDEEQDTDEVEAEIARHLRARPKAQPRMKLLYDNVTPTALRRNLAAWPSGLLASMDAGHILNGSIGRDLDLLNSLWDGDTMRSDTTDDSTTAYGPRMSALLLTQPAPTLRYLARRGHDAQGTGFFARMDWAYLAPVKATHSLHTGPKSYEAIARYQSRATDLLEERIRSRTQGEGSRRVVGFSASGQAFFNDLYRRVLPMAAPGGAFHGLGGYAAKIPERVGRYACIIHVFNDLPGLISAETLYHAELIVQWYTRQFTNMLVQTSTQTQAMHDAQWLEQLIWEATQRGEIVRPADLSRICPTDWGRPRRHSALQMLCASGRARIARWKHVQYVQLSSTPQLPVGAGQHGAQTQKNYG